VQLRRPLSSRCRRQRCGGDVLGKAVLRLGEAAGLQAREDPLGEALALVDHFDFLINNAGQGGYSPINEVTEAFFDDLLNVHFKGVYFLTQKLLPLMNDGGGIVNISSGLARVSMPGSSVYGSLKSAVETFTRYLAKELGPRGIRANVVAPGAIMTDFGNARLRNSEDLQKVVSSITALGRPGVAEDIGGVVAFLCTEDARWVNGQRIEASGGMQL